MVHRSRDTTPVRLHLVSRGRVKRCQSADQVQTNSDSQMATCRSAFQSFDAQKAALLSISDVGCGSMRWERLYSGLSWSRELDEELEVTLGSRSREGDVVRPQEENTTYKRGHEYRYLDRTCTFVSPLGNIHWACRPEASHRAGFRSASGSIAATITWCVGRHKRRPRAGAAVFGNDIDSPCCCGVQKHHFKGSCLNAVSRCSNCSGKAYLPGGCSPFTNRFPSSTSNHYCQSPHAGC